MQETKKQTKPIELEILQKLFGNMAQRFPGLMHISTIWPKNEKEPSINPKHMPTKDNLLIIWGDGLIRRYTPDRNMKHWLIKPTRASWDINQIRDSFQNLPEKASRFLCEKELLPQLALPEYISKLSTYKLNNNQKEELWVLVVHELGNTKRFISKPSDMKATTLNAIAPDQFEKKLPSAYYEVQNDFFYESSLIISRLLDIENLNKQKLSQTCHSLDFRSVNWFGNSHSFTATQAAIVKTLWEARENGTPDIGQDALLEQVGSESNRLVDVFKNQKTYKQLIGPGKTKGSYRLIKP